MSLALWKDVLYMEFCRNQIPRVQHKFTLWFDLVCPETWHHTHPQNNYRNVAGLERRYLSKRIRKLEVIFSHIHQNPGIWSRKFLETISHPSLYNSAGSEEGSSTPNMPQKTQILPFPRPNSGEVCEHGLCMHSV